MLSGLPHGIKEEIGQEMACWGEVFLFFLLFLAPCLSASPCTWNFWPPSFCRVLQGTWARFLVCFLSFSLFHPIFTHHHCSICSMSPINVLRSLILWRSSCAFSIIGVFMCDFSPHFNEISRRIGVKYVVQMVMLSLTWHFLFYSFPFIFKLWLNLDVFLYAKYRL